MLTKSTTSAFALALVLPALAGCGSTSADSATVPGVNDATRATTAAVASTSSAETPDQTAPSSPTTERATTTIDAAPPASAPSSTTAPPPTDAPPPPATTIAVEYLRQGDEGPRIATMQRELITLDLLPPGSDSGVFDSATNSALLQFQGQWGLIVDGVYGPETDRALSAAAQSVAPD